jgi:hypothetical protein
MDALKALQHPDRPTDVRDEGMRVALHHLVAVAVARVRHLR